MKSQPWSQHQSPITKSAQLDAEIPRLEMVAQSNEGKSEPFRLAQSDPSIWQIKTDLDDAIAKLSPPERQQLAQKLYQKVSEVGIDWQNLNLSTQLPEAMSTRDVSQLAAYAYQFHGEIFQAVFLEKPQLIYALSDTLVTAIISIMAMKWINGHPA